MKREIGILVVVFVTIIVMVSVINALNDYIEPLQVNLSTTNVEQGGNFTISGTIQPTRNINCFNPKNPGQNSFPVLTQEFKR